MYNKILTVALLSHRHSHGIASEFFTGNFEKIGAFLEEVIFHALIDTLPLIPFLFLTYLLMEFIEHKAEGKTVSFLKKSGPYGSLIGGVAGIIPQCGFSSVAANLFCAKIVSMGAVIAVFLSTSDEMLPLLISNSDIGLAKIAFILIYKLVVAIAVGFLIDLILRLTKRSNREINVDELCDNDNCHCEKGIFHSALHHTLKISLFILICTLIINSAVYFIGSDNLVKMMYGKPFISHLIAAVFGLIPNCAASVALTEFYTGGFITLGTMLSGLFSSAGIGLLVLFKVNKNLRENLSIIGILIFVGTFAGLLADVLRFDFIF